MVVDFSSNQLICAFKKSTIFHIFGNILLEQETIKWAKKIDNDLIFSKLHFTKPMMKIMMKFKPFYEIQKTSLVPSYIKHST